ncbi:MAG: hypothetical protein ACLQPD_19060 [Desulfomonilaceae bacterium]
MSNAIDIEHYADCEPLLELATPHIYRHNLFRVLGLSVNASSKDVQRQQNRRKMQERLGVGSSDVSGGPLALDPAPTEEDIRSAMERLHHPMDRLLDEIFWFWPLNGPVSGDPALKALGQGQVRKAADFWMEQAELNGHGEIAIHNLAVLDHMSALDYEVRLASGGLTRQEQERLAELWPQAFARWKQVLNGEEFWALVKNRIRELDDAQLTTDLAESIRSGLPLALLLISAKIAYNKAESSDTTLAGHHIDLVRRANFGNGIAERAIQQALKPLRKRLNAAIDSAKQEWTSKPHLGNKPVRQLYEQASSLLAVVDRILLAGDPTRAGLHNIVADAMFDGAIAFANKTCKWLEGVELLQLAKNFNPRDELESTILKNIEIMRTNTKPESGLDWCSPDYWDLPKETIAQLESARDKVKAGDYEGALKATIVMDRNIGRPLRQCVSFCLQQHSLKIHNEAFSIFDSEPPSGVKRFIDEIKRRGTVPMPNPRQQGWQRPACIVCGCPGVNYSTWIHGEWGPQRWWLCGTRCEPPYRREMEEKRKKRRSAITEGFEYLMLAAEVDPNHPFIKKNLENRRKIANNQSAGIPQSTGALKQRLSAHKRRSVPHIFEPTEADQICHFCGENPPDPSCQIIMPICGDVHNVELLFTKGIEYRYGDLVVPRCRRCRDEHRELPSRVEKWLKSRLAAADDKHFPEAIKEVGIATKAFREARIAMLSKMGVAAAVVLGVLVAAVLQNPLGSILGAIFLSIGIALTGGLKWRQWRQGRELEKQRSAENEQQRHGVKEEAKNRFEQAVSALKSIVESYQKTKIALAEAKKKLKAEKERAVADFERVYPKPQLSRGVKPESAYLTFGPLVDLRNRGWGFGHELKDDGKKVVDAPINVRGLVDLDASSTA